MTPDRPLSKTTTAALVAVVVGCVCAYYRLVWGSLDGFGRAIDHYEFFADFVRHFYPMGRRILAFPYPIDGFYYSAFFALVLQPVGELSLPAAQWVWGVIQVALAAALAAIPIRAWLKLTGWRLALYVLLFVTSIPLLHNFKWGQVSVLVTLSVLASLQAHGSRRDTAAGIWLAFGVAIKYYAAWFVLYYLIKRQWRVLLAFAAALIAFLVVIPSLILGPIVTYQFHREAYDNLVAAASLIAQDWNSQFFPHVVLRLLHVVDAPRAVFALSIVGWGVALGCLAIVWMLRRHSSTEAAALSATALFLALPFLLSTSWAHYLVYLPFCQVMVWTLLWRSTTVPARHELLACVALSVVLASVFVLNVEYDWSAYAKSSMLFYADVLLIPVVFALARTSAKMPTSAAGA